MKILTTMLDIPSKVLLLAKSKGYPFVQYFTRWHEYYVYRFYSITNPNLCVGNPVFVLYTPGGELRLATIKEIYDILDTYYHN